MAAKSPVHPCEFPEKPWHQIHIDPKHGFMWLIVVDAQTKRPEVILLKSVTGSTTTHALLDLVSRFGIPSQIVSDNGPQFVGEEFRNFCAHFGIEHIRTLPYHPRSNGEAECFVRTVKRVTGDKQLFLKKCCIACIDF